MNEKKPRRPWRTGDKVTLTVIVILAVFTVAIHAINAAGLRLVEGSLYVFLPLLLALFAVGWGCAVIVRRIRRPALKRIVAVVMVVAMLGLAMLGLQYGTFASGLSYPTMYAMMTSPGGHRLIVMRGLDADEQRIYARRDARLAADPNANPDVTLEDWGYVYTAYAPGPLDLFYRVNTLIEGRVCIGYASKGELMLEWNEDETEGRFFIKNPEPLDEGEMRARVQ